MTASLEYTDWHLTKDGWLRGSEKTDSGLKLEEPPADRIATFRYSEEISYIGPTEERLEKTWMRRDSSEELKRAIEKYGECPRRL